MKENGGGERKPRLGGGERFERKNGRPGPRGVKEKMKSLCISVPLVFLSLFHPPLANEYIPLSFLSLFHYPLARIHQPARAYACTCEEGVKGKKEKSSARSVAREVL